MRGYVLAGGRSSRMGVDKAGLRLGGRTLLEIAVGKLGRSCGQVTVVGRSDDVLPGLRVIADTWPGCGPLGGMEAALADAGEAAAFFLPVDMPLLPLALVDGLAALWGGGESRVCVAVADGQVQPLLSLLRGEALPEVRAALGRGEFKVRPVLERAGRVPGAGLTGAGGAGRGETGAVKAAGISMTAISTVSREQVWPGWVPGDEEWAARDLWFANLNTPEEFRRAERRARRCWWCSSARPFV